MTTVWISHNPFLVETEIIIDDIPIAETSRLYKYIKTPMQNWVGSFLPTLVEHCNDDELNITFKGLTHNYEDLESELNAFHAKNRDYEIELHFDACQSQIERLEILNAIREKMKNQLLVPELPVPADPKAQKDILNVLVLGGNSTRRGKLMESLSEDSSVSGKFCPLLLSELDLNYEAVERSVNSDEKPILICLLDENTGSKANAKIMNMISDSYKVRSKFHKWRFIFVADNPQYAKRLLSSDFAIKNADVYASDDLESILRRIEEYRNEVCLTHRVVELSEKLMHQLSVLKQRFDIQAEQQKKTVEINELEQRAYQIIDNCALVFSNSGSADSSNIHTFFQQLDYGFTEYCHLRSNAQVLIRESEAIEKVNGYVRHILPKKIQDYLNLQAEQSGCSAKVYMKKPMPDCEANAVVGILQQFGCESLLQYIKTHAEWKYIPLSSNNYPHVQEYLTKINEINIRIPRSAFERYADFIRISKEYSGRINGNVIDISFYNGLCALVCKNLSSNLPMSNSKKNKCRDKFKEEISTISPYLIMHLQVCQLRATEEARRSFDEMLLKTREDIKAVANKMRRNAQISAAHKERSTYVQQLLAQTEAITRL